MRTLIRITTQFVVALFVGLAPRIGGCADDDFGKLVEAIQQQDKSSRSKPLSYSEIDVIHEKTMRSRPAGFRASGPFPAGLPVVEDRVLIRFKPGTDPARAIAVLKAQGLTVSGTELQGQIARGRDRRDYPIDQSACNTRCPA